LNIATRDHSRLSYGVGDTQLGDLRATRNKTLLFLPPAPERIIVRSDRRGQWRAACVRAVFRGEDGKRTVADQLEYLPAMLVNCRNDCIGASFSIVPSTADPSGIDEPG